MTGSNRAPGSFGSEQGFTLVELVLAVVLLGIVGAVLTETVFVGTVSTRHATRSLRSAAQEQVLLTGMTRDVRRASAMGTDPTPSCGTDGQRILWTGSSPASAQTIVDYRVVDADGETLLVRQECSVQAGADPVPLGSAMTLASWSGSETFSFSCDGRPACAPATLQLAEPLAPDGHAVALVAGDGLPATDHPFDLGVGAGVGDSPPERVLVTGTAPTGTCSDVHSTCLSVIRTASVSHDTGEAVRYVPSSVTLTIPERDGPSVDLTVDREVRQ